MNDFSPFGVTSIADVLDEIPIIGHLKALQHYSRGEYYQGRKALKAATRNTVVMGAGAIGLYFYGPGGAIVGGIVAGAGWDVINAILTDGREINGVAEIIENPKRVEAYINFFLQVIRDGMAGYAGGELILGWAILKSGTISRKLVGEVKWSQGCNALKAGILACGGIGVNLLIKVSVDLIRMYHSKGIISDWLYEKLKKVEKEEDSNELIVVIKDPATIPLSTTSPNAEASGDDQPPQRLKRNKMSACEDEDSSEEDSSEEESAEVEELRRKLTKLLNRIRNRIREARPAKNYFHIKKFYKLFGIFSELLSDSHSATLQTSNSTLHLVIASQDGSWSEAIEYQIAEYLDVPYQLIDEKFPESESESCPNILEAEFELWHEGHRSMAYLDLSLKKHHKDISNVIYGIRCRLCDRRDGPGNICYVGLTKRKVHDRVCKEHANSVKDMIEDNLEDDSRRRRPMYEHAMDHYLKGHPQIPVDVSRKEIFKYVMDVFLLPIPKKCDDLRSWECFWQFFCLCREFFMGWSQR